MRWGKTVLIFQAVITLIIGTVFLSQLITIDKINVAELKTELTSGENFVDNIPPTIIDIKQRYSVAAYLLFVVAIIELLIISRFLS